jgi:TonB-dependent SusC/RagA subfamily outer membrane receptor
MFLLVALLAGAPFAHALTKGTFEGALSPREPARRMSKKAVAVLASSAVLWAGEQKMLSGKRARIVRSQGARTLTGDVSDIATGRPLTNVTVTVLDTDFTAQTDESGTYRLLNVPSGHIEMRVSLAGYATVVARVAVARARTVVDFELASIGAVLAEVIVRGRHPEVDTVNYGPSVDVVGLGRVQASNASGALAQIPGVRLLQPSGLVGSRTGVQMRGTSTLHSGKEPLVYVDGVRMVGSEAPGSGIRGQNVLDLIPAWEIDRIEVLKGPAATALYGTGALNGVILVYTKKGIRRNPK